MVSTGLAGCGYQALYAPHSAFQLSVAAGQILVPDTGAVQAALAGARAEVAAAGRLSEEGQYPRLLVDVLRVDEVSHGIHVQSGQPAAGGMGVAVVLRGRVLLRADQESALDTGDVRRAVQVAGNADVRTDSASYGQAMRAAAERAGRAVSRMAMGIPEPNDEAP